jgi:hypothetical protein
MLLTRDIFPSCQLLHKRRTKIPNLTLNIIPSCPNYIPATSANPDSLHSVCTALHSHLQTAIELQMPQNGSMWCAVLHRLSLTYTALYMSASSCHKHYVIRNYHIEFRFKNTKVKVKSCHFIEAICRTYGTM